MKREDGEGGYQVGKEADLKSVNSLEYEGCVLLSTRILFQKFQQLKKIQWVPNEWKNSFKD